MGLYLKIFMYQTAYVLIYRTLFPNGGSLLSEVLTDFASNFFCLSTIILPIFVVFLLVKIIAGYLSRF